MGIQFEVREFPSHLVLVCTSHYTYESLLHVYEQAFALAAAAGRGAALIDARQVTGQPPTIQDRYNHSSRIADLQSKQVPRIRLAALAHEPMVHPQRFGEIVAVNRGAVFRAFTDEAMALDWLLAKSKPA